MVWSMVQYELGLHGDYSVYVLFFFLLLLWFKPKTHAINRLKSHLGTVRSIFTHTSTVIVIHCRPILLLIASSYVIAVIIVVYYFVKLQESIKCTPHTQTHTYCTWTINSICMFIYALIHFRSFGHAHITQISAVHSTYC